MAGIASDPKVSAVRLRGLPFQSKEQDVFAFFAQHDIVHLVSEEREAVRLLTRPNGRPSGQAVVQMRDHGDAEIAQRVLGGQYMGNRYIEVFPHIDDENLGAGIAAAPAGGSGSGPTGAATAGSGAVAGHSSEQAPAGVGPASAATAAAGAAAANAAAAATAMSNLLSPQIALPGMHAQPLAGVAGNMSAWPMMAPWSTGVGASGGNGSGGGDGGDGALGQVVMPDASENNWEALFQFLGPEGTATFASHVARQLQPQQQGTGAGAAVALQPQLLQQDAGTGAAPTGLSEQGFMFSAV